MVSIELQEILATIQRNQQQIDLLTANNTQLCRMLLMEGMRTNFKREGMTEAPSNGNLSAPTIAMLPEAEPPKKQRGQPPKQNINRRSEAAKKRWADGVYDSKLRREQSERARRQWEEQDKKPGRKPTHYFEKFEL